ncbi:MAG: OmpA family protein [Kofleriaceae bacterium]|nr:OmpA family protein [Kofleriaceae bacterium]
MTAVVVVLSGDAQAQSQISSDYSVERFRIATDAEGILDVEWANVPKHLEYSMAVWLGYSDDPLTLYSTDADGNRTRQGSLVSSRTGGSITGVVGLLDRYALGVSVPLVIGQSEDQGTLAMQPNSLSGFGLGDIVLTPKVALLSQADVGVHVGLSVAFTLPTGKSTDYFGDPSAAWTPEVLVSRSFDSGLRLAANLGYRLRKNTSAINLVIGDEIYSHAGVGYRMPMSAGDVELDLTYAVATAANDFGGSFNRNFSELRFGAVYDVPGPTTVFAATGFGTSQGYGAPDWRALLGLRFQREEEAEELPPVAAPVDSDGDGILDKDDDCPAEAETINGVDDSDGCPDEIGDADGDGLNDQVDQCPQRAEDNDGFEDEDGCPDDDNDKDGILDAEDECRDTAGVASAKGCPDPDRDGDTVVDRLDLCPDIPGEVDLEGCKFQPKVSVGDTGLMLLDRVYFKTNKAEILPVSYALLDNVAQVLTAHTEIAKVRVEGHTDSRGSEASNASLSDARAKAVMAYLVNKGVEASRLSAVGVGEAKPIASNATDKGRTTNRRVEFVIVGGKKPSDIQRNDSGPSEEAMDQ